MVGSLDPDYVESWVSHLQKESGVVDKYEKRVLSDDLCILEVSSYCTCSLFGVESDINLNFRNG